MELIISYENDPVSKNLLTKNKKNAAIKTICQNLTKTMNILKNLAVFASGEHAVAFSVVLEAQLALELKPSTPVLEWRLLALASNNICDLNEEVVAL